MGSHKDPQFQMTFIWRDISMVAGILFPGLKYSTVFLRFRKGGGGVKVMGMPIPR